MINSMAENKKSFSRAALRLFALWSAPLAVGALICLSCFPKMTYLLPSKVAKPSLEERSSKSASTVLAWLNFSGDRALEPILNGLLKGSAIEQFESAWALGSFRSFQDLSFSVDNPQITEALLHTFPNSDPWLRTQIIETLTRREEERDKKGLRKDNQVRNVLLLEAQNLEAQNNDPLIRAAAIRGLRLWEAEPDVRSAIEHAAADAVWLVRRSAIWTGSENVEILKNAAVDEDPYIRLLAVQQMSKYESNPEVRDILIQRLRDPSLDVIHESLKVLTKWKEEKAISPILDLLNIEHLSGIAALAVSEMTGRPLQQVIHDMGWKRNANLKLDAYVREPVEREILRLREQIERAEQNKKLEAIFSLTWIRDLPRMKDILLRLAEDPQDRIRFSVLYNLYSRINYNLSDQEIQLTKKIALKLLSDSNFHIRVLSIDTVGSLYKSLSTTEKRTFSVFLLRAIDPSENPFVRSAAVSHLNLAEEGLKLQQLLVGLVNDDFYEVRIAALSKLDPLSFPKGLGAVLVAMSDPISRVRLIAVRKFLLREYLDIYSAHPAVIKTLQALSTEDSEAIVREAAKNVLSQFEHRRPK